MARLKAWDKFQLLLQTARQEGCFIAQRTKECVFVRKVCACPRLVWDLRSLEIFTATITKCTQAVFPKVVLYFNEFKYFISSHFQVFGTLFVTEVNTQGFF